MNVEKTEEEKCPREDEEMETVCFSVLLGNRVKDEKMQQKEISCVSSNLNIVERRRWELVRFFSEEMQRWLNRFQDIRGFFCVDG